MSVAYRRGTGAFDAMPAPEEAFNEGTSRFALITLNAGLQVPFIYFGQQFNYSLSYRGIKTHYEKILRLQKWCAGNTPRHIVNACMKELQATGYLSNRGRQIVASCFIYELGMDWRYGAAWFEQQLVGYDVGSNWGNWQYLAGVGADPRGSRHFNLDKQAQQFDPDGRYQPLGRA
ncbi:FAD-binding domain-containing protein [Endozoicomonas acroporae]|uniref:FAD-binding domain-containing protein n=1 Tax=Endozoicomonas acroporae TaxID=1701104 RepID=UPI001C60A8B4|nr:FAD-binding domain-containing protein [Endozoicomonas acroporae]